MLEISLPVIQLCVKCMVDAQEYPLLGNSLAFFVLPQPLSITARHTLANLSFYSLVFPLDRELLEDRTI